MPGMVEMVEMVEKPELVVKPVAVPEVKVKARQ